MRYMSDEYTLSVPVFSFEQWETSPLLVLASSPIAMRKRVEKFARYFKREFRTDFLAYEASEVPGQYGCIPYEAHLFFEEARDLMEEDKSVPYRIVGAACFRWQTWSKALPSWEFSWVWLHPFARGRGHLSKAWPAFEQKYGHFAVSTALSRDMAAFLTKRRADLGYREH